MTADLAGLLRAFFDTPPQSLGVAVSGGGDSTALLVLLDDWRREGGPALAAATVDHGLRPEAATEAAQVASLCARLGVPHETIHWHWDGKGNLMDAARRGRMRAIADWARGRGIGHVALGHTLDDQAETFLMRLARGSGVDGLSAMQSRWRSEKIGWLRPLLYARRGDLRTFLQARGIAWTDDPTNEDPAYERANARRALGVVAPLGLTAETLAATANWMSHAREALDKAAQALARRAVREDRGDLLLYLAVWGEAPLELQLRLLSAALRWVSGAEYRPRLDGLTGTYSAVLGGKRRTLSGCVLTPGRGVLRITREYRAVRDLAAKPGEVWDGRWTLEGPAKRGLTIRALGEPGLSRCPDWRATELPRLSLVASPSVWRGEVLLAAPLAGLMNGWTARLHAERRDFVTSLVTH